MAFLTPFELDIARGTAFRRNIAAVQICRGEQVGCTHFPKRDCKDCFLLDARDPRSSAEILDSMRRGDA